MSRYEARAPLGLGPGAVDGRPLLGAWALLATEQLDPAAAPDWHVRCRLRPRMACPLSSLLQDLLATLAPDEVDEEDSIPQTWSSSSPPAPSSTDVPRAAAPATQLERQSTHDVAAVPELSSSASNGSSVDGWDLDDDAIDTAALTAAAPARRLLAPAADATGDGDNFDDTDDDDGWGADGQFDAYALAADLAPPAADFHRRRSKPALPPRRERAGPLASMVSSAVRSMLGRTSAVARGCRTSAQSGNGLVLVAATLAQGLSAVAGGALGGADALPTSEERAAFLQTLFDPPAVGAGGAVPSGKIRRVRVLGQRPCASTLSLTRACMQQCALHL